MSALPFRAAEMIDEPQGITGPIKMEINGVLMALETILASLATPISGFPVGCLD
jgi:hypothetical protein